VSRCIPRRLPARPPQSWPLEAQPAAPTKTMPYCRIKRAVFKLIILDADHDLFLHIASGVVTLVVRITGGVSELGWSPTQVRRKVPRGLRRHPRLNTDALFRRMTSAPTRRRLSGGEAVGGHASSERGIDIEYCHFL
jgi:hypothetical protein